MRRFFSAGMSCTPVVARAAAVRPAENPARPAGFPGGGVSTLTSVASALLGFETVTSVPSWIVANDSSVIACDAPTAPTVATPINVTRYRSAPARTDSVKRAPGPSRITSAATSFITAPVIGARFTPGAASRYDRSAKVTILPMSASPPGGGSPAGPVDTVAHPALSGIPRYCGFSLSWPLRVVGMGWVLFKLHTGRGVSHGQANGKQEAV